MIIDHFGIGVSDYERAKAFYAAALAPLGITLDGHNVEAVCHKPE
jgi:catechol 2,3-dioxygenase-like lactoylglutathione lyase family enzyme